MTTLEDDISSSTTSGSSRTWTYDVFLSFRGEDTRYNFTGNLYNALRQRGIHTFIDDEKLKRGEEISPTLLKAIEESRVSIVIFSENYANSSWCLDELVTIIECMKSKGQWVLPVFYKVDPSDIRHQRRSVGKALTELEKKPNIDQGRGNTWRWAMHELANLSGSDFKNGYEFHFIQKIIQDVYSKLDGILLHIANQPVGLESRILKVNSLLKTESNNETQIVGIHGFGGIGKTTLARAIYNHVNNQFECKAFLANVREHCSTTEGLVRLQKTLLSKMLGETNVDLGDVNEGTSIIKHRLCRKKILLVLDDVDKSAQLRKLVGGRDWFGSGSKIIITTRDKHILAAHVDCTYQMEELDDQEALELFCWNAFKKSKPHAGYEDITLRAIRHGKNLPLFLEIIGSDLYGKEIDEWKCTLDKYEKFPNREIHNILSISYDNLHYTEKQIFLDIACFFRGMSLDSCKEVFKACGFYPDSGIRVLLEKSLINIKENMLWMHDLIQDMGREIVRQDSPELGKRSRLWFHEDAQEVLTNDMGTDKIEGIMLRFPNEEKLQWSGEAFKRMKNLRILMVENAYFSEGPKHLPNNLRVLDWKNYPSMSLPPDFHPKNLVVLSLLDSRLKLKESLNFKKYQNLIYMDFSHCLSLEKVPEICGIPNLVELYLDHCFNLVKVDGSVGLLKKLVKLSAKYCYRLSIFPPTIESTTLEYLNLRECNSLTKFPEILEKMEKIKFIDVSGTSIEELPSSFQNLVGIEDLHMVRCLALSILPSSLLMLQNLKELNMGFCPKLQNSFGKFKDGYQLSMQSSITLQLVSLDVQLCQLSDEDVLIIIKWFPKLKNLNLSYSEFQTLPASIKGLVYLESIALSFCNNLREITAIPPHLQNINAIGCPSLTKESSNIILNQGLYEIDNLNVLAAGGEIPEWFDHRSEGGYLSFFVRGKFPVIILCSVMGAMSYFFQVELSLSINGVEVYLLGAGFSVGCEDTIWMHDLRDHMSTQQWENLDIHLQNDHWNRVEISFTISTGKIKGCGVHAYKQETSMENVRFTSRDPQNLMDNLQISKRMEEYENTTMKQEEDSTLIKTRKAFIIELRKIKVEDKMGVRYPKMWVREANDETNAFQMGRRISSDKGEEVRKDLGHKSKSLVRKVYEHASGIAVGLPDPFHALFKTGLWVSWKLQGAFL
ncbi:Disease resistance protein [Quillaja saponaria]|uniref:Disease resistance protein n=1 Tax=Quillaja saponaria TaxID=32244 RepID=A0AAD7PWP5_QUISA|nr:Disease resistance protein [Quillaja saponaria]